jgi:UDP-N-acetylglucosamine pyrophosphorylase
MPDWDVHKTAALLHNSGEMGTTMGMETWKSAFGVVEVWEKYQLSINT